MRKWSETFRLLWSSAPGNPANKERPVILHDPDARRPQDLDDPFLDQKVKERIAETIAKSVRK
jgi:hypothetical protein